MLQNMFYFHFHTEKMVLLQQQNSGQQIKFLLPQPKILLQQPNVLLTERNILLLSQNVFAIIF